MLQYLGLITLMAVYMSSNGQILNTDWISRYNSSLLVLDSANWIKKADNGYTIQRGEYVLNNDTITFIETDMIYVSGGEGIERKKRFVYKIHSLSNDSVTFIRCDKWHFLGYQCDTVTFDKYQSLYDPDFTFKRIYFFTTMSGFGTGPAFEAEIFSNGLVYFYGYSNTGKYKGTCKGQLNKKQLDKLIAILRSSNLKHFPEHTGVPIDAASRRMVIEYSGGQFNFCGSLFPYSGHSLFNFFMSLYKNAKLKKCIGCRAFIEKSCYEIEREQQKELWDNLLKEDRE